MRLALPYDVTGGRKAVDINRLWRTNAANDEATHYSYLAIVYALEVTENRPTDDNLNKC